VNTSPVKSLSFYEFVALMALMMSLVALSIDAILPALGLIANDLEVISSQTLQLVITSLFVGLGIGQLLLGPLSDSFGRKPIIYLGYVIFFAGSFLCVFAPTFEILLAGRFIQGLGLAAPRVLTTAIIRDKYAGREMAQVMSFIFVVFIIVPMLAPLLGQFILLWAGWPMVFGAMLAIGIVALVWFAIRQPETLKPQYRQPLRPQNLWAALKQVCQNRVAIGYTLTAGIISGAFFTYLGSAQPLFQQAYNLGDSFALYFAGLALAIGLSSLFNGKMVVIKGMQYMVWRALTGLAISSAVFLIIVVQQQGMPPLMWTTIYLVLVFSCIGILFGNLNALAMEPLGHLAGMGAAVVGSLSTLISAGLAIALSRFFDHTMVPLTATFLGAALAGAIISYWVEKNRCAEVTQ